MCRDFLITLYNITYLNLKWETTWRGEEAAGLSKISAHYVFFLQSYKVVGVEFQGVKMSHSTAIINVFFINHVSFEMFEFKQLKTVL